MNFANAWPKMNANDPEILLPATLVLGWMSWVTATVSQSFVAANVENGSVGVMWFAMTLQLFLNTAVTIERFTSEMEIHHHRIANFSIIGAVFSVIGVDMSIYSQAPSHLAMAAGWLVVAVVDISWVFYFTPPSGPSEALRNIGSPQFRSSFAPQFPFSVDASPRLNETRSPNAVAVSSSIPQADQKPETLPKIESVVELEPPRRPWSKVAPSSLDSPRASSSWMHENSDTDTLQTVTAPDTERTLMLPQPIPRSLNTIPERPRSGTGTINGSSSQPSLVLTQKAEALYDYYPSASDPDELSLRKGELLDVPSKPAGTWWEARKDGKIGLIPSNFVRIVSTSSHGSK